MRETMDWSKLQRVYELAGAAQVSFSVTYEEGADEWYGEVFSSAPTENFMGKSRGFDFAIDDMVSHLMTLQP